jgi:hypothetical protein
MSADTILLVGLECPPDASVISRHGSGRIRPYRSQCPQCTPAWASSKMCRSSGQCKYDKDILFFGWLGFVSRGVGVPSDRVGVRGVG